MAKYRTVRSADKAGYLAMADWFAVIFRLPGPPAAGCKSRLVRP